MNLYISLFFLILSFYQSIFSLTIVAQKNVNGTIEPLKKNDKNKDTIITIIKKYEWPLSLLHCNDEERKEIYAKQDNFFKETTFIEKKIREETKDTSYCAFWIPPMLSQAYMMYLFLEEKIFKGMYQQEWRSLDSNRYTGNDVEKNFETLVENINNSLFKNDTINEPFIWKYYRLIVKFLIDKKFDPNKYENTDLLKQICQILLNNIKSQITHNKSNNTSHYQWAKDYYYWEDEDENENKNRYVKNLETITENRIENAIIMEYDAVIHDKIYFPYNDSTFFLKPEELIKINTLLDSNFYSGNNSFKEILNTIEKNIPLAVEKNNDEEISKLLPINRLEIAYDPFKNGKYHPLNFSLNHLDFLFYDSKYSTLFTHSRGNEKVFYFSLPREFSKKDFRKNGFLFPCISELLTPFISGKYSHGHNLLPRNYIKNTTPYTKSYFFSEDKITDYLLDYYSFTESDNALLKQDKEIEKIYYAYLLSSIVENTIISGQLTDRLQEEDYIKINQSIVTRYYRHLLLKKTENYERKSLLIKNLKKYIPHTLAGIAVITLLYKTNKEFAELLK